MAGSRLEIDGRTVARGDAGPLDAEYAAFDPGDLELKATEPGNVREIGYRTTAKAARARFAALGVTAELARAAAEAFSPLAPLYARGGSARKVADKLGATELFEGRELHASGTYLGAWMDLPALAADLALSGAGVALQALHLASLLTEVPDDAVVMLHTLDLTRGRRTGERTYQRPDLSAAPQILEAMNVLGETSPTAPAERAAGPTRMELVGAMTERLAWMTGGDAKARLAQIVASATVREQPGRGPLADPDLWPLERRMSEGSAEGVLEALEPLEKRRGRTPATTYLRARAMLMGGLESPDIIAGRVSTLALSMSSFVELQLLAAQAWLLAGDGKRAAAYARDLTTSTAIDPELRARAEGIFAAAMSQPPPPSGTSRAAAHDGFMASLAEDTAPEAKVAAPAPSTVRTSLSEPPGVPSQPARTVSHSQRPSVPYSTITGERPSRSMSRANKASGPPDEVPAEMPPRGAIPAPRLPRIPEPAPTPARRPTEPPARRPDSSPPRSDRPAMSDAAAGGSAGATRYMKGASQPPFRSDDGAEARQDKERRLEPLHSESAEFLSLPRMATGEPPDPSVVPRNPTEARILFTYLARELGEEYRTKRGVELRTDIAAIEAMQSRLYEAYHGSKVHSLEDWLDVRRHGALLSEILVRTLGAEWTDVNPRELGYWSMTFPSGTRVWPFARVLRYVAMGPKERDLVSYYLELKWRSR